MHEHLLGEPRRAQALRDLVSARPAQRAALVERERRRAEGRLAATADVAGAARAHERDDDVIAGSQAVARAAHLLHDSRHLVPVDGGQPPPQAPAAYATSLWQIAQAATCTLTSSRRGGSSSISSTTSGSPKPWHTAAFTARTLRPGPSARAALASCRLGAAEVAAWFNAPMPRHTDQRALVTGGTSGIGEAVVTRLAEEGARVVFTGRDEARGAAVAQATGGHFVAADARDGGAVAASVAEAVARLGGLEIVVLNAGVLCEATLSETSDEQWDTVIVHEPRRPVPLRPGEPAGSARDQRLHGARRLRRRRLGRDADRRLLGVEARRDHARAHARRRGRARAVCA